MILWYNYKFLLLQATLNCWKATFSKQDLLLLLLFFQIWSEAFVLIKQNFYLLDDGHSPRRKWPWILYVVVDDAVKHLLLILAGKRRLESQQREVNASNAIAKSGERWWATNQTNLSHEHLVDEDAHPPPVHCTGVVVVCQDLGGQKLRSPTEGGGSVPVTYTCRNDHKTIMQMKQVESLWARSDHFCRW